MIGPDQPLTPERSTPHTTLRTQYRTACGSSRSWWCAPAGLLCWAIAAVCYPLMGLPAGTFHTTATWLLGGFTIAGAALITPLLWNLPSQLGRQRSTNPTRVTAASGPGYGTPAWSHAPSVKAQPVLRTRATLLPGFATSAEGRHTLHPAQAQLNGESLGGSPSQESVPVPAMGSLGDRRCRQAKIVQRCPTLVAEQRNIEQLSCDSKVQYVIRSGPATRERRTIRLSHSGARNPQTQHS